MINDKGAKEEPKSMDINEVVSITPVPEELIKAVDDIHGDTTEDYHLKDIETIKTLVEYSITVGI